MASSDNGKTDPNTYIHIVRNCQMYFNFDMPSTLWAKRVRTVNVKFSASNNMFCKATGCLAQLT